MTPEPEPEYYQNVDEQYFDGEKHILKPLEQLVFRLSRFEKCKAGTITVRTTYTEITTSLK